MITIRANRLTTFSVAADKSRASFALFTDELREIASAALGGEEKAPEIDPFPLSCTH